MSSIIFLLDIMGTKHYITKKEQTDSFLSKIHQVDKTFANTFQKYHLRSRSMKCLIFSDSYIIYWDDPKEAIRLIIEIVEFIKINLTQIDLDYRVFIELGNDFELKEDRTALFSSLEGRFLKYSPISISSWGAFLGEGSHFSKGIYFSDKILAQLPESNKLFNPVGCKCGRFEYHKYHETNKS